MKFFSLTILALILGCISLQAQESLPFETRFITQAERDAWTEYRMGSTVFFNWNFPAIPNSYAHHDYPVGAGVADTTLDWLVSPAIHFHSTSVMEIQTYAFSLIGTTPEDRFEVWMSTGSPDPAMGDYAFVADLTNFDNGWGVDTSFALSDTGMGYVALLYQATQNWFTIDVDSIAILPDVPLNIESVIATDFEVEVWPNPATRSLNISWDGNAESWSYTLYNLQGQAVLSRQNLAPGAPHKEATNQFPAGIYVLEAKAGANHFTKQVVIR